MRFFLLVLLVLSFHGKAQVSVPHLVPDFGVFPFFNETYIVKNSIRKIGTTVMFKYPMKTLIGSVKKQEFTFQRNGMPYSYAITSAEGHTKKSRYMYAPNTQLESEISLNHTTYYSYDKNGFLVKERIVGEDGNQNVQQYRMERVSDQQTKKYWLNNEQLTYKYAIQNTNQNGQLVSSSTRYIRGAYRTNETWQWKQGWLLTYVKQTREFTSETKRYSITYSTEFEVQKMEVFTNDVHSHTWEYLYEDGLLTAILIKDLKTQCITITKIDYEYW